jgi:elongation factor G
MVLKEGAFHAVDSSELAFRLATIGAFREVYKSARPVILEPIMTVEVVAPVEFQSKSLMRSVFVSCRSLFFCALPGQVIGSLNTRRGTIVDSEVRDDEFTAVAEVALNDMFGYSNALRGCTQGKGMFTSRYTVEHPLTLLFAGEFSMEYKVSLHWYGIGY